MNPRKNSYPPIHIGTSFMLVIFLILCMVVFAILSLSNAQKDYSYSQRNAERVTEYYEACNLAEETLADLAASGISGTSEYMIPINDTEALQVIVELDTQHPSGYHVTTWKQISTKDWIGDQSLPVLLSK